MCFKAMTNATMMYTKEKKLQLLCSIYKMSRWNAMTISCQRGVQRLQPMMEPHPSVERNNNRFPHTSCSPSLLMKERKSLYIAIQVLKRFQVRSDGEKWRLHENSTPKRCAQVLMMSDLMKI